MQIPIYIDFEGNKETGYRCSCDCPFLSDKDICNLFFENLVRTDYKGCKGYSYCEVCGKCRFFINSKECL